MQSNAMQRTCDAVANQFDYAATILDEFSTAATTTKTERFCVTLNINTDYLTAIPKGEQCKVVSKLVKLGR